MQACVPISVDDNFGDTLWELTRVQREPKPCVVALTVFQVEETVMLVCGELSIILHPHGAVGV